MFFPGSFLTFRYAVTLLQRAHIVENATNQTNAAIRQKSMLLSLVFALPHPNVFLTPTPRDSAGQSSVAKKTRVVRRCEWSERKGNREQKKMCFSNFMLLTYNIFAVTA
jgi:hypothetical protein